MSTYTVEVYDNSLPPDERIFIRMGRFESAAAAVACAMAVIDASLDDLREQGLTAALLYIDWLAKGEGVRILGTPTVDFSTFEYARARAFGIGGPIH